MSAKIVCPQGDSYRWCPDCKECRPKSEFSPSASYCRMHQLVRSRRYAATARDRRGAKPLHCPNCKATLDHAHYMAAHRLGYCATCRPFGKSAIIPATKQCRRCRVTYTLYRPDGSPLPPAELPFGVLRRLNETDRLREVCNDCHRDAERARAQRKRERPPAVKESA